MAVIVPEGSKDFGEVPDEFKVVDAGRYTFQIEEEPKVENSKSGNGKNLIISAVIQDEGEFFGRKMKWFIYLSEMGMITLKRLAKACGIEIGPEGFDTADLVGVSFNAVVSHSQYDDPDDPEQKRTRATIKDVILET